MFATEVLYDHNITTNVLYNRLICGVSSMSCVLNGVCNECKHNIHSIHFNLGGLLLQKETKKSTTHWHMNIISNVKWCCRHGLHKMS